MANITFAAYARAWNAGRYEDAGDTAARDMEKKYGKRAKGYARNNALNAMDRGNDDLYDFWQWVAGSL